MNECLMTPQQQKISAIGYQNKWYVYKKLKLNMYILKIHTVINTVKRDVQNGCEATDLHVVK